MEGAAFSEAVQEGEPAFQKEDGEAKAIPPAETATAGTEGAETEQTNGSEPEKTPSEDEPQNVSPRAQERYRELARQNRELREQLENYQRSVDERLQKAEKPQAQTEEEKYLQELAEYMYNYTQSKQTESQKQERAMQEQVDKAIKQELATLSEEYENFDPVKALEYSYKYGTQTLKHGYEMYLEAQRAREEARKEFGKVQSVKRATANIAGSATPSGRMKTEDVRGKTFADLRDEIYDEFGK